MILSSLKNESSFLLKNGLSVFLKLFSVALSFLAFRWINANLDPQTLESVNISLSINGAVVGFIAFGIPTLLQKIYTNYNDKPQYLATAWTTLGFLRLVSFVFGLVLLAIINFWSLVEFNILLAIFLSQFLFLTDTAFRSIVDSNNRSWQYSLSDLIAKIVLTAFLFILVQHSPVGVYLSDLAVYITALIVSACTAIGLDIWLQRKHISFTRVSVSFLKEHKEALIYLSLSSIVVGSFLTTDKVFLKIFGADEFAINGYANAYKLYETAAIIPGITMPVLASSIRKRIITAADLLDRKKLILRYAALTVGVGGVVTFAMIVFGPLAISLIDPKNLYRTISLESLFVLSFSIMVSFPSIFFSFQNLLNSDEKLELKIQIANLFVALVLYGLLISRFSYIGAAVSTLLIHTVDLIIRYVLIKNNKMLIF